MSDWLKWYVVIIIGMQLMGLGVSIEKGACDNCDRGGSGWVFIGLILMIPVYLLALGVLR